MDSPCFVLTVQTGGGNVMLGGLISWPTFGITVVCPACSRLTLYVTKLKCFLPGFLKMTVSSLFSTVSRSQFNRALVACGGTRESNPGGAAD